MTSRFVSILMGLGVSVAYALVGYRSPTPPVTALVGLMGILLAEQAIGLAKHCFEPPTLATIRGGPSNRQALPNKQRRQQFAVPNEDSDT